MDINEAREKYKEALAEKAQVLLSEISRMLCERPFLLDPGVTKQDVDGIHFEYEYDSFVPVACPLNIKTGYCGGGEVLLLTSNGEVGLFPNSIDEAVLASAADDEEDAVMEALDEVKTDCYFLWFTEGWKKVRHLAPEVRGFLSIHDTIWRTDLDTEEEF